MRLAEKDITKFQTLYEDKFNIKLDDKGARHKLSLLVRQMEIVHQPISQQQFEDLIMSDVRKRDAKALAELIYDIYKDEKGL